MKLGIAIGSAWIAALIFYLLEVPKTAGAHPLWADQVLISGVVVGTILAVLTTQIAQIPRIIGFGALSILAYFVAAQGKSRFAASYAEDIFGGQMWYFGWHALCAFMVAGLIAGTYYALLKTRDA